MRDILVLILWLILTAATAHAAGPDAIFPDGGRYYGPLEEGLAQGQGRLEWPNGAHYEGGFDNGRMHGEGVLVGPAEGARYEGEFANGSPDGHGTRDYPDGGHYVGEFRDGVAHGQGRLELPRGTVYEGTFRNGRAFGEGRLTENGTVYTGEVRDLTMHGEGRLELTGGDVYKGEFVDGVFEGEGVYEAADGSRHEGHFRQWRPNGEGVYTDADGNVYRGTFEQGWLQGEGSYDGADGSHYEGEFRDERFHGRGRLVTADGEVREGWFRHGEYWGGNEEVAETMLGGVINAFTGDDASAPGGPPADPAALLAEDALYRQSALLDDTLAAVQPQRPEGIDLYTVAVAGDSSQAVFRREVEYVRDQFAEHFGARGRQVVLANSRDAVDRLPLASRASLARSLESVAERMDPAQDILFLYLTSHGSRDHQLVLDQEGIALPDLPAEELAAMLASLPVEHKVVVISACYAGGFIPALDDGKTLVITAASADRTSFGCADGNDFTYFGRALFAEALPETDSLVAAFEHARELVRAREEREGIDTHSQPRIHHAATVERQLTRWRASLTSEE